MQASVANYNAVLVTLLGDVASNYVQVRTLEKRLELVRANVELQRGVLNIARRRFEVGRTNELDVSQARSNLAQTEAQAPQFEMEARQACDRLCVLLGIAAIDLQQELGGGPIPTAPTVVAVGMPADLLRRRPDVQRAERLAAAQGEQIGIAEAALYPAFAINGVLGYQAANVPQLLTSPSLNSSVGPSFQWNLLNYGRIVNNVRFQDATFQELLTVYQRIVIGPTPRSRMD